ncbi:hypothetical protein CSPX01_04500 [Colletotrichum filicis]|nr:hypothetical protein CSPX01_04500 [Colletotrichum filicis]
MNADTELRAFAARLRGERSSGFELKEQERVAIVALVLGGRSYRNVAAIFGCSLGAVASTVRRYNKDHTFKVAPRKGRPKKVSGDTYVNLVHIPGSAILTLE